MRNKSMIQILVILLCLMGYHLSSAQSDYLVLLNGDTLTGKITYQNYGYDKKVQLAVDGKKKTSYSMMQVKAFQMNNDQYHLIRMIDHYSYMKPVFVGYLSLYKFQLENQQSWDGQFLIKRDGSGIEVPNIGFKKRMTDFLSECSSVADEIEQGNYNRNDLEEIISRFNDCIENRSELLIQSSQDSKNTTGSEADAWKELETATRKSDGLENKETILEMITEAKTKTERGEKIPNFIIDALVKAYAKNPDLSSLLEKALVNKSN